MDRSYRIHHISRIYRQDRLGFLVIFPVKFTVLEVTFICACKEYVKN